MTDRSYWGPWPGRSACTTRSRPGTWRCAGTTPDTADQIADAIDHLAQIGPALGRPLVDRIHASRHHNMKELRPPSTGATEVRMLFAFDPQREAIFLVGGDKSGQWNTWYRQAIPLADQRFDQHLHALREAADQNQQEGRQDR